MVGSTSIALRRRGVTAAPIRKQQKALLDDVASHVLELLRPHLETEDAAQELHAAFRAHPLGLQRDEFVAALMPFLFSDLVVNCSYFQTKPQTAAHLQFIFDEIDAPGGRIGADDLIAFLEKARWRLVHRMELGQKPSWINVEATDCGSSCGAEMLAGNSNTQLAPDTPPEIPALSGAFMGSVHPPTGRIFGLVDSTPRPQLRVSEPRTGAVATGVLESLRLGLEQSVRDEGNDSHPYPTAVFVAVTFNVVVIATTCNSGSHLHVADPATGAVRTSAAVDSYQTALCVEDAHTHTICGGSTLGEVSFWRLVDGCGGDAESDRLPDGAVGGKEDAPRRRVSLELCGACRSHNGPVIAVKSMQVHGYIASVGTDGLIALTDPLLFATVRTIVASPVRPISCCAFGSRANFIVTCSSDADALVWHGSLPDRAAPVVLQHGADTAPHEHAIVSIEVAHTGFHVVTLDGKGTAKIWDQRTRKGVASLCVARTLSEQRLGLWKLLVPVLGGRAMVVVSSDSTHVIREERSEAHEHTGTQVDSLPLQQIFPSTSDSVIVAVSRAHVQLYNTGSGALQQSFEDVPRSRLTACALDEKHHRIVIGEANGDVAAFDLKTAAEVWRHARRHAHAVTRLACGAGVVLAFGEEGVLTSCRGSVPRTFVYEEKSLRARSCFFLESYEAFGVLTTTAQMRLYEVTQDGNEGSGSTNLMRAHAYDLGPALDLVDDEELEGGSFSFLGSIALLVASVGPTVVLLSLSTARVAKLTCWEPSEKASVTHLAFLDDVAQLVVGLEDGHIHVFDIANVVQEANALPSMQLPPPNAVSPPAIASHVFRPLRHTTMTAWCVLRSFGVLVAAGETLEAVVFGTDGVRVGMLDMFTTDSQAWQRITAGGAVAKHAKKPAGAKAAVTTAKLGSGSVKSVLLQAEESPLAQVVRKATPKVKHRTTLRQGTLQQRAPAATVPTRLAPIISAKSLREKNIGEGQGASSAVRASPGLEHLPLPNPRLSGVVTRGVFVMGLNMVLPAAPPREVCSPPRQAPQRPAGVGERSSRTLRPLDAADAHWTLDYHPPKERDKGMLLALRTMTKGLNPSAAQVEEQHQLANARFAINRAPRARTDPAARNARLQPLGRLVSPVERFVDTPPPASPTPPPSWSTDPPASRVDEAPLWLKRRSPLPPSAGGFHFH